MWSRLPKTSDCRWGARTESSRVLVHWSSTSGKVECPYNLSLGFLVCQEYESQELEVRIVFKNFGAWSFKSDSGLGQRSVRLQKRESGGPGLGVLVWKAYAVYITVGN